MFGEWLSDARILIIDDEPANLGFLEELLAKSGYSNVVCASEPSQAELLFQAFRPDLILLDWLMPGMNGQDVLHAVAPYIQQEEYLPILVLTADISRQAWQTALSTGAKDFLVKPLDITEVLLRIRNLLETRYLYLRLLDQNQALRESETKFRTMFQGTHDIVMLLDPTNHTIIDVNPAVLTVLGYSETTLRNQTLHNLFADHLSEPEWSRLQSGQGSLSQECTFICADGSTRPIDLTIAAISWDQQPYLLATAHDASGRKKVEADMLQALTREKELNELKSQFISMASHEFSQPLSTIRFLTDLLQRNETTLTLEKRTQYLSSIHNSVDRMIELTEAIMFIGRSDMGRMACVPKPVLLKQTIKTLLDKMRLTLDPQHTITLNYHASIDRLELDTHLLDQILINLLSNAVKYSPAGGVVTLELYNENRQIIFKVSDQGIGIPPEAQTNLFSSFFRARNVGKIPGHGLGLTIVKRCVDAHQGTIAVESRVGEGTTFTVTIPYMDETSV